MGNHGFNYLPLVLENQKSFATVREQCCSLDESRNQYKLHVDVLWAEKRKRGRIC